MPKSLTPERIEQTSAWLGVFRDSRLPGMVNVSSQSLAEAADVVDALATAVARARREALEEAAMAYEAHDRVGRDWVPDSLWDAVNRAGAARVRALAATPPEARQTETGWKARISFELSLSPEGRLRVAGITPRGLILSSADHDALLADIGPAIRGLLNHSGEWPPAIGNLEGEGRS